MNEIIELLSYSFFQNAIGAAILASISCGIIGTYIVSFSLLIGSGFVLVGVLGLLKFNDRGFRFRYDQPWSFDGSWQAG